MNQILFDRPGQTQQLYRAYAKYNGPTASTPSVLSEYLSSAKTQTSNNRNSSNKVKPLLSPQNISKPLISDQSRIKTQTLHIPPKQPVSHHIKSLSSDIRSQPQAPIRRRTRQEKMIFQSEFQNTPFLIISNKVRDTRRLDTIRKSTLPSIQTESFRSSQSITNRISELPLVAIHQPNENQTETETQQLMVSQEKIVVKPPPENEENQFIDLIKRKVSILESDEQSPEKITEIQHEVEEEIQSTSAMKKLSVKMKFKNAVSHQVSSMLNNRQLKSLFTVIISQEFNEKHEEERQKISDQFEAGNFILGKSVQVDQLTYQKKRCMQSKYVFKHPHKVSSIIQAQQNKLATTNKAFQRKVQMIKGNQLISNDHEQPQFSMLTKHKKQSVPQACQIVSDSILPNLMDDSDKITLTITNEQLQITTHQFSKPKFMIHMDTIVDEQAGQASPSPLKKPIPISNSLHTSFRQFKLQNSINSSIYLPKDQTVNTNIQSPHLSEQPINEDTNGLDFNLEFSKANLYVRLYYQNRLYKLPKKINFASPDIVEIQDIFDQYNQFQTIRRSQMVFQSNQEFTRLDKVLEIENFGLQQKIDLEKYSIQKTQKQFSFDFDNSLSIIENNSEKSNSFDQILEEPNQSIQFDKNRLGLQVDKNHENKMKTIIESMKNLSDHSDSGIFIEDVVKNQKCNKRSYLEISTGLLNPIKKVKNQYLMPLTITPILSILDQQTKNDLLTFQMMEQSKQQIEELIHGDSDTAALQNLDKFYNHQALRQMIVDGIEIRYSDILIGRYVSQSKMVDVEHQDLTQSVIPEIHHQISSSQQSQQSQQSQELLILQKQKLINFKNQKVRKNLNQLQQRDSLTVIIQPKLRSKQTSNSPEATHVQSRPTQPSSQYTNQLTYNVFTQASTQYLTKPTNQSQQSVKISSQKNLDENLSHPELSPQSSLKSIRVHGQLDTSNIIASRNIKKSEIIKDTNKNCEKKQNREETMIIQKKEHVSHKHHHTSISKLEHKNYSMFSASLRMRNQALEHIRRQHLTQLQNLEQLIYDNNYQEFLEHVQQIPQMYIDTKLSNNDTFLTLAAKLGCKEMVRELIKRGADINTQNDDGNTAAHLAISYGHHKVADILIGAGAHTSILNNDGKNAWTTL